MPTNFVIGQILMLLAYREIKAHRSQLFSFPLICAVLFSALIFVPVTSWYFYHFKGWSEVYLRPEENIAAWVGPGFFLQYVTGMFFGCLLAQLLIQQGKTWAVFLTLTLGVLWLAVTWGFTLDQYLHVGTFSEYQAGSAKNLLDDEAFQTKLNIGGAIMVAPLVGLAYWFIKRSQRLARKWF